MTLPDQPASPLTVLGNEEFFRIYQQVTSPGDFFEIDSSTRAVYLGPMSDVSEIRLQYFDVQAQRSMTIADISAGAPFVGRLDSLLGTQYPGINQPARIGAFPIDIVIPSYTRSAADGDRPSRNYNIPPYIDLICALKDLPTIPTIRPDRTYRLTVPMNNEPGVNPFNGSTDVYFPIYGRRMISIQTITPISTPHITSIFQVASPANSTFVGAKYLGGFTTPSSTAEEYESIVVRASDQMDGAMASASIGSAPPNYTTTGNWISPLPSAKGMADLLVVNFLADFTPPAPADYSLISLIVRVSDSEEG